MPVPLVEIGGLSDDGKAVVLAYADGTLAVQAVEGGSTTRVETTLSAWGAIGIAPDKARIAAVGLRKDRSWVLVIWEVAANQTRQIELPTDGTTSRFTPTPLFSPDGTRVLVKHSISDVGQLVDAIAGRVIASVGRTSLLAFSPDGRFLVSLGDGSKTIAVHDAASGSIVGNVPAAVAEAFFRPDGKIAAVDFDCAIQIFDPRNLSASSTMLRAKDGSCSLDSVSHSAALISTEMSRSSNQLTHELIDLMTGRSPDAVPVDSDVESLTLSGPWLLRERGKRLTVAMRDGRNERTLRVSEPWFDNDYRSRSLAAGRLLSDLPDEPLQVFDLATGARVFCLDRITSCAAQAVKSEWRAAVADGRPEGIVAALGDRAGLKSLLGSDWGESRIDLAKANLVLGDRSAARTAFEEAVTDDLPAVRAAGRIGLVRTLLDEAELARAQPLVAAAISDLEKNGATPEATSRTLVRQSNGLRIELAPVDMAQVPGLLGELDKGGKGDALDETAFETLSGLVGFSPAPREMAQGSVAYSRTRIGLVALLGEAQTLAAEALLMQSRSEGNAEKAQLALAALDRFSPSYDGDRGLLAPPLRAQRQSLRAEALQRLDQASAALGPRVTALEILRADPNAPPLAFAQALRGLGDTQASLDAFPEARASFEEARDLLRKSVPEGNLALLEVQGLAGLILARNEGDAGAGLTELRPAVAVARKEIGMVSSDRAVESALRLRRLFGAGVEAVWLDTMKDGPDSAELAIATPVSAGSFSVGQGAPGDVFRIGIEAQGAASRLEFSDDGTRLISYEYRRAVTWDTAAGLGVSVRALKDRERPEAFDRDEPLDFPDGVRSGTFGPGTFTVASGQGLPGYTIEFGEILAAGAVSPDGKWLMLSAARSPTLRLYDANSGVFVGQLDGNRSPVRALAWTPDSTQVATAGTDGAILVFAVETKFARAFGSPKGLNDHGAAVSAMAFAPDSNTLVTIAKSERKDTPKGRVWDLKSRAMREALDLSGGKWLFVLPGQRSIVAVDYEAVEIVGADAKARIRSIANSDDGRLFVPSAAALAGIDAVVVTSFEGGTKSEALGPKGRSWLRKDVFGEVVTVSDDSRLLVVAQLFGDTGQAVILNAATGQTICKIDPDDASKGHYAAFAFSPDHATLIGFGSKLTDASEPLDQMVVEVSKWDTRSCKLVQRIAGDAAGADREDQTMVLGGPQTELATRIGTPDDPVMAMGFSKDGSVAWAQSRSNLLWLAAVDSKRPPVVLAGFAAPIGPAQFSPDGRVLAVASDSNIWLWDVHSGALIGKMGN